MFENTDRIFIVMEVLKGDLHEYWRKKFCKVPEKDVLKILH